MADNQDSIKRIIEAILSKIPKGECIDHNYVKLLHEAGVTYPDANIIKDLQERSRLHVNGSAEYIAKRHRVPRKKTEFDHHLYTYPYQDLQLHDDLMDIGYGGHYDRELPVLDERLLTDETTENVFRMNKNAAALAVEKCISDAFFSGDIGDHDLFVKAGIGIEFIGEKDNVIAPLFKTIISASLKRSDTEHRVNKPSQPPILLHNDFSRKKAFSKSFEAQMCKLKSDSLKLRSKQRQIVDVKNTGNFWRLTQRRLYSRASSRGASGQSPRGRRLARTAPAGYQSDAGGFIDHFPLPPTEEREHRELRKSTYRQRGSYCEDSVISMISHYSKEVSDSVVASALDRLHAPAASLVESETLYSDDFHTVSDVKPFSDGTASIISQHVVSDSITLDNPRSISALTNYTSSFEVNSTGVAQSKRPAVAVSWFAQNSIIAVEGSDEDEYDSDEERLVAQARLETFKHRLSSPPTAASSVKMGNKLNLNKNMPGGKGAFFVGNKNRATILRNVNRNLLPGEVSIHEDSLADADRETEIINEIMNAKPKPFIPFSLNEDAGDSSEEEDDNITKKPALPVFSSIKPKSENASDSKSPILATARRLSARPQSAPITRQPSMGSNSNLNSSTLIPSANASDVPDIGGENRILNVCSNSSDMSQDSQVKNWQPKNRQTAFGSRRTSIYAPDVNSTVSVQQSRPSLGKDDEDDEFGLRDLEDALTESLRSKSMKEDDDYNMTGDFGADDINPDDYDNVNEWLAAQMQAMINEINRPQDKPKRELTPKRHYKVPLKRKDLELFIWLMDDSRKGCLTFEDVKTCYIDQRKRKKYFHCKNTEKVMTAKRPSGEKKSDFGSFSPRRNNARLTAPRKLAGTGLVDDSEIVSSHTTCRSLISDPIVLFRIMFFAATQDQRGCVRLMSAYQHYSQLYATMADERFRFVFQTETGTLKESDEMTLSELVKNTTDRSPGLK